MKKELLSPVGNWECLIAAIGNGADAIYLSSKSFNARKYAMSFTKEELKEAITYAHLYGVKTYITVNIIIYNEEINEFIEYIDYLYQIGADALIMQDIGMIYLVHKRYPDFEINASTQMHNHSADDLNFLKELGVKKAVLDRELSLSEINSLNTDMQKEVFIHGALCNAYSGCCLFSSMTTFRSGNRGMCSQSCRMPYHLLKNNDYLTKDYKYLLSTKELNTTWHFISLMKSDITSFKIEGRMRSPAYVGYVTRIYRKLMDNYYQNKPLTLTEEEEDNLKILYNRKFTSGYLFNENIMNIDTSNHQGLEIGKVIAVTPHKIKIKLTKPLYQEDGIRFLKSGLGMVANLIYNTQDLLVNKALKGDIIYLENKINLKENDIVMKTSSPTIQREVLRENLRKIPLDITVHNDLITFEDDRHNTSFAKIKMEKALTRATTSDEIKGKLIKLGNTPFILQKIQINIPNNVFVSMKDLNNIRRMLIEDLIAKRTLISRDSLPKDEKLDYEEERGYPYEISVHARTKEQVEASLGENVDRIYTDEELYREYQDNPKVYFRLPRVSSEYNYPYHRLLVTTTGGVYHYQNEHIVSDYFLNVVNNYSIDYLVNHHVERVTLSPEINYDYLDDYFKDKVELIIYGRLELMLTKSCPISEVVTCPCNKEDKYYLEDINKNKYPIIHENNLTHIMHYQNINYLDKITYYKKIGIRSYRLELFDEGYDEVVKLINKIRK